MRPGDSLPAVADGGFQSLRTLLAVLRLGWFVMLVAMGAESEASTAIRSLPTVFTGTNRFEVVLEVTPDPGVLVYTVEESSPLGWQATALSDGGSVDGAKLKWGPFIGSAPRILKYQLAASAGATLGLFHGTVEFDSGRIEISGDNRVERFVGLSTRTLPPYYTPGVPMTVIIAVVPAPDSQVWAMNEQVPTGWIVSVPSHGGAWDASTGRIKWGVFTDAIPRSITYQVTPPATERGAGQFLGKTQFGATEVVVAGASSLSIQSHRLIRRLPESYVAGDSFAVQIDCQPASHTGVHTVEEAPPPGVAVASIDPPGVLDVATGKIKWGPFVDRTARTLGYRLRPSSSTRGMLRFGGTGVFDALSVSIDGPSVLTRTGTATNTECIRSVASTYVAGKPLTIQLHLTVADGVGAVAVEDEIPAGWIPGAILQGGTFDASNRKVKWLWPGTTNDVVLTYTVTPPVEAVGAGNFSGMVWADRESIAIGGTASTDILRGSVTRTLPPFYFQGTPVELRLDSQPSPGTRIQAIEETLPAGWTLVGIDGGGTFDAMLGRLKWGPFADSTSRQLKAQILPPPGFAGIALFDGIGVFDRESIATAGANRILAGIGPANRAPTAVQLSPSSVAENSPAGTIVGTLSAVDPDVGDHHSFELTGDGGGRFVSVGNLIMVRAGATLDFESNPNHVITVVARDTGGLSRVEQIVINVVDVPDTVRAKPDAVEYVVNRPARIPVAALVANDSNEAADALKVTRVDTKSLKGGSVRLEGASIVYTPSPGYGGLDLFNYQVGNGTGSIADSYVVLYPLTDGITPVERLATIERLESGAFRLKFSGIPGFAYVIEGTSALGESGWKLLGSRTAGVDGRMEFIDSEASSQAMRYYRAYIR